jgi:hypothetical protein
MNQETLIYTTPNSEEILRKINGYEFRRIWESKLEKNNKNLLGGIIVIFISIIFFLTQDYLVAGLFAGSGIMTCVNYIYYYSIYRKNKKRFNTIIDREAILLMTNSTNVTWEFSPTHFSFKDYKSEHKFIWNEITYCILDDHYLYITASHYLNFILDKNNIDKENLSKTIDYLASKAQFKKI